MKTKLLFWLKAMALLVIAVSFQYCVCWCLFQPAQEFVLGLWQLNLFFLVIIVIFFILSKRLKRGTKLDFRGFSLFFFWCLLLMTIGLNLLFNNGHLYMRALYVIVLLLPTGVSIWASWLMIQKWKEMKQNEIAATICRNSYRGGRQNY